MWRKSNSHIIGRYRLINSKLKKGVRFGGHVSNPPNLQVLDLQVMYADVTAEGVIDSSHCPIDLLQLLPEPAQLS